MKVAIIHDWIVGKRGGERVLEEICKIYPQADIFTLVYAKGSVGSPIEDHRIYESFVNRFPFAKKKYRHYLPIFPTAVEKFDLRQYDLVISSSHCVAKGVITKPSTLHVSYVHSPMRYVWDAYYEYFSKDKVGPLPRVIIAIASTYLRTWDVASSQRIDSIVANSQFVSKRIKKYWGQPSTVIHPPVDLSRFTPQSKKQDFYLVVSALVPYKRVDLAIKAANKLHIPLKVVGVGPELTALKKIAGPTVEFLGALSDRNIATLFAQAKAFIFPGEEDFGITPLEAMASGTPVIAYGAGGALETVKPGQSGLLFNNQTEDSLVQAIKEARDITWKADTVAAVASAYDNQAFRRAFKNHIDSLLQAKG